MKTLSFFFITVLFFACTQNKKPVNENSETDTTKTQAKTNKAKPYFIFDEIIHYSTNADAMQFLVVDDFEKKVWNKNELLLRDILLSVKLPSSIEDTSFIEKLTGLGFKKSAVQEKYYPFISELFSEKKIDIYETIKLIPVYREIWIFKRHSTIIGIAKICDWSNYIVGATGNTENFGQDREYVKLDSILEENKRL